MTSRIVAVHSISAAAAGWKFQTGEAVACFALISAQNPEFANLAPEVSVIPLGADDLQDLVSREVDLDALGIEFEG